jgi:hypothetical protein
MKNLSLSFCIAITSFIPGCLAGDTDGNEHEQPSFDGKADSVELAFYSVDQTCSGDDTCVLRATKVNTTTALDIAAVNWPAHDAAAMETIEYSLYGARVIVRGHLASDSPSRETVLEGAETWLAASGGFLFGEPYYVSLQPVRSFCPATPCPTKYSQGALNGSRRDDIEVDMSRLPVPASDLALIQAQLDGDGIVALGHEETANGAKRFVVDRAYMPVP